MMPIEAVGRQTQQDTQGDQRQQAVPKFGDPDHCLIGVRHCRDGSGQRGHLDHAIERQRIFLTSDREGDQGQGIAQGVCRARPVLAVALAPCCIMRRASDPEPGEVPGKQRFKIDALRISRPAPRQKPRPRAGQGARPGRPPPRGEAGPRPPASRPSSPASEMIGRIVPRRLATPSRLAGASGTRVMWRGRMISVIASTASA